MVNEIRIYIEGGADKKDQKDFIRQGFSKFFNPFKPVRVVRRGSGSQRFTILRSPLHYTRRKNGCLNQQPQRSVND